MGNQSTKKEDPCHMKRPISFEMISRVDLNCDDEETKKENQTSNQNNGKGKKHNQERSKDDLDVDTLSDNEVVVNIPRKKKDMISMITKQAIEIRGHREVITEGKKHFVEVIAENERCVERIEERDRTIAEKNNIIQQYSEKNAHLKREILELRANLNEKTNESNTEIQNLRMHLQDQGKVAKKISIVLVNSKSNIEAEGNTSESNGNLNSVEERVETISLMKENEHLRARIKERESLIEEGKKILSTLNRKKDQLERELRESERNIMDKQFALDKVIREKERDKIQLRQKEMETSAKGQALNKVESDLRRVQEELKRNKITLAEREQALEKAERLKGQAIEERQNHEQHCKTEIRGHQENILRLHEEKRVCEDRLRRVEASKQVQERTLQSLEADRNRAKHSADILRKNQPWMITKDEIKLTDRILGTGAWGKVFEGNFRGMKVAVKELHEVIQSAHNKHLFDREITFATLVRHSCILQFLGVADYQSNSPLLVTELMDMSLAQLLMQEKIFRKSHVTTLAQDTAYGLNYLHCFRPRPIIHRDVNPGNVMVWRQGDVWRAKLCDFGSADFVSVNMSVNPGNPFYSAPEVNTPKQTVKVDVYSYGVLLCELATSQPPNPEDRIRQITRVRDQELKQVIERCIKDMHEDRPNMGEVIEIQRTFKIT